MSHGVIFVANHRFQHQGVSPFTTLRRLPRLLFLFSVMNITPTKHVHSYLDFGSHLENVNGWNQMSPGHRPEKVHYGTKEVRHRLQSIA